jgi:hypothetical protein
VLGWTALRARREGSTKTARTLSLSGSTTFWRDILPRICRAPKANHKNLSPRTPADLHVC